MLFIKPELVTALDAPGKLHHALQYAIELEHSTIPPYLYAWYSLGTENAEVADLIASVVFEEMAHFALACNLLNAVGGHPRIDDPKFIPAYPGPLPATIESGLTVPLKRASKHLVEDVFMTIEEPETKPHVEKALAAGAPHITIGMYYNKIKAAIEQAGDSIFTGKCSYQLTHNFASAEVVAVTNAKQAGDAIDLIVEQGEGTTTSPFEGEELAHYFRFMEIAAGEHLQPWPDAPPGAFPWRLAGPPIDFDESKVLPVIDNPKLSKYPSGSAAYIACRSFNYTYTNLLKVLHTTFNGHPDRLPAAIGLMESMNEQAQALMSMDSGLGGNAGPSFEYQLTNQ